jgi:hypothetical protein
MQDLRDQDVDSNVGMYPLIIQHFAIENGPFIVDLPINSYVSLPEGKQENWNLVNIFISLIFALPTEQ